MTLQEMQSAIGQPVLLEDKGLTFVCLVEDVKITYGQPRFLIQPIGGTGKRWVEFSTIKPCHVPAQRIQEARRLLAG